MKVNGTAVNWCIDLVSLLSGYSFDSDNVAEYINNVFQKKTTVAIVGQMRSGKSTLLNALIGRDVAPTAINECTATINRFSHSDDPGLRGQFLVHWKDETNPESFRPIDEIDEWVGESKNAKATAFLDFFADTDFLKTADIVDTPGLRSTLDSHESAILSYLTQEELDAEGDRLADATRKHGSAADAVIYVVNLNARQSDKDILDLFGEKTRLPGSNTYNSVAVIHKWELEWQDMNTDPFDFLQGKIERLEQNLSGKVSCVIAVSGLLCRCFDWLTDKHWTFFVRFGALGLNDVKKITRSSAFTEDGQGRCLIPYADRIEIYNDLSKELSNRMAEDNAQSTAWTIIRFICRFACVRRTKHVMDLQNQIKRISGMEELTTVLEKRFFARSRLIKMGTVLSKLREPTRITLERLQLLEKKREKEVFCGQQVLALLEKKNADGSLQPAIEYVHSSFDVIASDVSRISKDRKKLYNLSRSIERQFKLFEQDFEALELLDTSDCSSFTAEEMLRLRALFGVNGMEASDRLSGVPTRHILQQEHRYWASRRHETYGLEENICEIAEDRIKEMLANFDINSE